MSAASETDARPPCSTARLYVGNKPGNWPVSAARAAGWPRLAVPSGSLRRDLALKQASRAPAGRRLSQLGVDLGAHYVAFLRLDGGWFRMSDSRVTQVDEAAVLKAQAFLLFYERLDGNMYFG